VTRATWLFAAAGALLAGRAAAVEVFLEPVHAGVVRMDALYVERAGAQDRAAVQLALGAGVGWRDWQLGVVLGRAASDTDFGLLDDPGVRLERADTRAELRWRPPLPLAGWALQAVAGAGRLNLRYHPDRIAVAAGGETFVVALDETATWTRHVAAEVLHELRDTAWIVLRAGMSFYALDVATPQGPVREDLGDLHCSVLLRVRVH